MLKLRIWYEVTAIVSVLVVLEIAKKYSNISDYLNWSSVATNTMYALFFLCVITITVRGIRANDKKQKIILAAFVFGFLLLSFFSLIINIGVVKKGGIPADLVEFIIFPLAMSFFWAVVAAICSAAIIVLSISIIKMSHKKDNLY